MHPANAQRRNHFIQHDRRTDQYQYPRQNSHETSYGRNNVTNPSAQNGSWRHSGRHDHFNNWNMTKSEDTRRQGGGPAVYERAPRRDDGARDFGGHPPPPRAQHFPPQRTVQDWEIGLNQRNEEPEVDEWGREIRQASMSSEDDNDRERNRSRMDGDAWTQSMENGRGHYERPQKRQRSWERETRDDRYNSASNNFHRNHHPAVNKRPRLESFPSHQPNTWNKPSNHFPHRSHPVERDRFTDGFADDINQFEVPILANVNVAPVAPPMKGYYSRKPAVQATRGSDASTTDFPKAGNPEISSLPLAAQLAALSCAISSLAPVATSSPQVTSGTSPAKTSKPGKSALVKQFFFDDDDEEIPALPPLQDATPTTTIPPVQLAVQVDSKPPTSLPEKKAPTPILPLSPVSKSPPTPRPNVASASPPETTMEISPSDIQPSDTRKSDPDIPPKSSKAESRVLKPKNVQDNPAPSAINEPFEFMGLVGIGAYGKVFKAKEMNTGKLVALKKIRTESQHDGFPVTALREIKLLQSLHHTNVVTLQEMVMRKGSMFLKFEYVEHDLVGLLHQTEFTLLPEHIKSLAKQLCEGLAYIHSRSVLHRDLKTANLLVTSQGTLKLGDFGLARFFNKRKKADYTNRVCTYWYRAPELMLGETVYGPEIDIWSAGCIFMEMFLKTPPFCAEEEVDQLQAICTILGTPTGNYAPHLLQKPWYPLLSPVIVSENVFRDKFTAVLPCDALEFAGKLLHMDGPKRPSASAALDDTYFSTEPTPCPPNLYAMKTDWHEYEYQNWRRKERHAQESRPSATTQIL